MQTRIIGYISLSGALLVLLLGSSVASAGSIFTNIPDAGIPHFYNSVKVSARNGTWKVTGQRDLVLNTSATQQYSVTGSQRYLLTANFSYDPNTLVNTLDSGTLVIKGGIAALGLGNGSTLLTATLDDFNYTNGNLAFATTFDLNNSAICGVIGCTTGESVWLDLAMSIPADFDFTQVFKTTGTATTTIPVPAAVWLFGSGLGFLGATAIRRKKGKAAA